MLALDELWSFVQAKAQTLWLWVALCRRTRQIVAWSLGDRSEQGAADLRASLPPGYRRCATRSDLWRAYQAAFPARTHRCCGKEEGETCHRRALVWHPAPARQPPGSQSLVLLQVPGEPPGCHPLLHHHLQPRHPTTSNKELNTTGFEPFYSPRRRVEQHRSCDNSVYRIKMPGHWNHVRGLVRRDEVEPRHRLPLHARIQVMSVRCLRAVARLRRHLGQVLCLGGDGSLANCDVADFLPQRTQPSRFASLPDSCRAACPCTPAPSLRPETRRASRCSCSRPGGRSSQSAGFAPGLLGPPHALGSTGDKAGARVGDRVDVAHPTLRRWPCRFDPRGTGE